MIYLVYLAADAGQELSGLGSGGGSPSAGRSSGSSSCPPVCSNQRCQPQTANNRAVPVCWSPCCSQVREVSALLFSEKLLFLLLFRAVRAVPLTAEPPRPRRALFSGNFVVMSLKEGDGRKFLCAGGICQP